VRPENGIAPAVNFIHRDRDNAIAVGVFEREIDPDLGGCGKPCDIEFARRDHDLPLGAVDVIAIDVNTGERVIGPQSLDLLELRLKRAPIPNARVLERGGVLFEVGGGERLSGHREFALLDRRSLKIIGLTCAGDAPEQIWQLQGNLVWAHIEIFDPGGNHECSDV
jgi:hypothetical protein